MSTVLISNEYNISGVHAGSCPKGPGFLSLISRTVACNEYWVLCDCWREGDGCPWMAVALAKSHYRVHRVLLGITPPLAVLLRRGQVVPLAHTQLSLPLLLPLGGVIGSTSRPWRARASASHRHWLHLTHTHTLSAECNEFVQAKFRLLAKAVRAKREVKQGVRSWRPPPVPVVFPWVKPKVEKWYFELKYN